MKRKIVSVITFLLVAIMAFSFIGCDNKKVNVDEFNEFAVNSAKNYYEYFNNEEQFPSLTITSKTSQKRGVVRDDNTTTSTTDMDFVFQLQMIDETPVAVIEITEKTSETVEINVEGQEPSSYTNTTEEKSTYEFNKNEKYFVRKTTNVSNNVYNQESKEYEKEEKAEKQIMYFENQAEYVLTIIREAESIYGIGEVGYSVLEQMNTILTENDLSKTKNTYTLNIEIPFVEIDDESRELRATRIIYSVKYGKQGVLDLSSNIISESNSQSMQVGVEMAFEYDADIDKIENESQGYQEAEIDLSEKLLPDVSMGM